VRKDHGDARFRGRRVFESRRGEQEVQTRQGSKDFLLTARGLEGGVYAGYELKETNRLTQVLARSQRGLLQTDRRCQKEMVVRKNRRSSRLKHETVYQKEKLGWESPSSKDGVNASSITGRARWGSGSRIALDGCMVAKGASPFV